MTRREGLLYLSFLLIGLCEYLSSQKVCYLCQVQHFHQYHLPLASSTSHNKALLSSRAFFSCLAASSSARNDFNSQHRPFLDMLPHHMNNVHRECCETQCSGKDQHQTIVTVPKMILEGKSVVSYNIFNRECGKYMYDVVD